jgi:hypothetical protein
MLARMSATDAKSPDNLHIVEYRHAIITYNFHMILKKK